jgi:hypothetical protein
MKIMADIINSFFSLDALQKQSEIYEIIKSNEESMQYGLRLSEKHVLDIVETRNYVLKSYGRIELGGDIINKIIKAFCRSQYINQVDYALIINELVETFYYIKNETLDLVTDDELIDLMKDYFNNSCVGSIELLQGRELENFARSIRYDFSDYRLYGQNEEDIEDDEVDYE